MNQKDFEALTRDVQSSAEAAGIKLISCKIKYEPIDALVTVIVESEDGRAGVYRADAADLLNPYFRGGFVQRAGTLGDEAIRYA
jgi:hypothetical protein